MSFIAAVNEKSSGFKGGFYGSAGRPTAVSGNGFAAPGTTAATPPGVPTSSIIEARNNSGSNVRIPYARLVPMHGRYARDRGKKDMRLAKVNGRDALEYDGLHQGEIAWVLGRRYKTYSSALEELHDTPAVNHTVHAGLGHGVDRMQRLASTPWIEAMMKQHMSKTEIDLTALTLATPHQLAMGNAAHVITNVNLQGMPALLFPDPLVAMLFKNHSFNSEMKAEVAKAFPFHTTIAAGAGAPPCNYVSGLAFFDMKTPFLKGYTNSAQAINVDGKNVARNIGDVAAIEALELEMRRNNLMDWSPDGIVLSKLESPSGDSMASTELDARSAQLFNVAVQGPAISTSWTSDLGDSKLICQPLDKVFICIVADLETLMTFDDDILEQEAKLQDFYSDTIRLAIVKSKGRTQDLSTSLGTPAFFDDLYEVYRVVTDAEFDEACDETLNYMKQQSSVLIKKIASAKQRYLDALETTAFDEITKMALVFDSHKRRSKVDAKPDSDEKTLEIQSMEQAEKGRNVKADMNLASIPTSFGALHEGFLTQMKAFFAQNKQSCVQAKLVNFRLMRATSSYLSNYSRYDPSQAHSRLGLDSYAPGLFASQDGKLKLVDQKASYIVGAWCIGTVLDSAASRSQIGQLVRTNPTSMALNVNVNVEWWSGDKLHRHYYDANTQTRGEREKRPLSNAYIDSECKPPGLVEDLLASLTKVPRTAAPAAAATAPAPPPRACAAPAAAAAPAPAAAARGAGGAGGSGGSGSSGAPDSLLPMRDQIAQERAAAAKRRKDPSKEI